MSTNRLLASLAVILVIVASVQADIYQIQGITVQTVDGKMLLRIIPGGSLLMVLDIPRDFVIVDGTHVGVGVDRDSIKPYQYKDEHDQVRTVNSAKATTAPHVLKTTKPF